MVAGWFSSRLYYPDRIEHIRKGHLRHGHQQLVNTLQRDHKPTTHKWMYYLHTSIEMLFAVSTSDRGASARTAAAAASVSTSGRGADARTAAAAASASTSGRGDCVGNAAVSAFVSIRS